MAQSDSDFWKSDVWNSDFWTKEYGITSFTRLDLVIRGFDRHAVEQLTDVDLLLIEEAMEDMYWTDFDVCVRYVLEHWQDEAELAEEKEKRFDEERRHS